MSFKQWYKNLDDKLIKVLEPLNLSKKYPNYFTKQSKIIFKIMNIIIWTLVIVDFTLNGFSFTHFSVSCPATQQLDCQNPYYTGYPFHLTEYQKLYYDLPEFPKEVCAVVPCDKEFLKPGEHYDNNNFLSSNGVEIIFLVILLAFGLNHLLYLKKKNVM